MSLKISITLKKLLFHLIYFFILFLFFFCSAEIIFRIAGYKSFSKELHRQIKVEPDGKKYQRDALLGYTHIPGKYTITLKDSFSFTVTHRENALRITHPIENDSLYTDKNNIWIMGCSFTYGMSLNDNETFAWLIQEKITDYEIINFGTSGYGTIHFLIQIEEGFKNSQKPEIVIIVYGSFHDQRNTFTNERRKLVYQHNFLGPLVQPYARIDEKGQLVISKADNIEYFEWPFIRYSVFINYLQDTYNLIRDKSYKSHNVTKAIILKINELCIANNIKLVVANIYKPDDMISFCEQNGIISIDISVDLTKEQNNNLPYDSHPSAIANEKFAERLITLINSLQKLKDG